MNIAYIILAHKNWRQLGLLIESLKEDWNDIFIHIDKKSDFDFEKFRNFSKNFSVKYVNDRVNVFWGHISIVQATINLLKMVNEQEKKYNRVILLSGQCFPLVSNRYIYNFFLKNLDLEFIEYTKMPLRWWPYGGLDRVLVYNFPEKLGALGNRILRVVQMALPFRRKFIKGFHFYGGSQWFNITGDASNYILERIKDEKILKRFNFTYCPDEIFFQTILMNSHFNKKCVNNSLRFCIWNKKKSNPLILKNNDILNLVNNDNKLLFARKFDDTVCGDAIEMLIDRLKDQVIF